MIAEWRARLMWRLDGERHRGVCSRCRHYVKCVAAKSYCPPYGLAARWRLANELWVVHGRLGGEKRKEEMVQELLEYKRAGWDFTDFCEICNFRCKVRDRAALEKSWSRHCRAIDIVTNEIPCPVGKVGL
jgi:hypothetical protein